MFLIFDFGSQTTHLIKRRLKWLGFKSLILKPDDALEKIKKYNPKGIILSGGPASVYEKNAPTIDPKIFKLGIPILGICYGLQLTAKLLGGTVIKGNKEYGPEKLTLLSPSPLFEGLPKNFTVWMSHGDEVVKLPKGFKPICTTASVVHAAIQSSNLKIFGVQFHPEIYHTQYGNKILFNFAKKICQADPEEEKITLDKIIEKIRENWKREGRGKVIAAVSGGVDSTVATALAAKALGKQVVPIYCENGLMRYNTGKNVREIFEGILKIKPRIIRCKKLFFQNLKGISLPEKKRKIIGKLYIKVFEREAKKIKGANFLLQGTIYSDVVESGKSLGKSAVIKSHHNVGGLPKKLKLKLLEPLREFYKDEVRYIGKLLGLPEKIINAQPFPGPGYAIRIIGEVNEKRVKKIKLADKILNDILKKHRLYEKVFQSFPVLTGIKSTAVKGDDRVYAEVIAIRIYESKDIMSADIAKIPYEVLKEISTSIVKKVPGVSRVVYDITTKPPATMEWE